MSAFPDEIEVRYIYKDCLFLMRAVRVLLWFVGVDFYKFWTTYRLPFMSKSIVAVPPDVRSVLDHPGMLEHENVHARQQRTAWGLTKSFFLYFFFPLPFLFSGRWFVERPAYLLDIKNGRLTIDESVVLLWRAYLFPWPRKWMRTWFQKNLIEKF